MVLNINPDIVCEIINRAREFHAKEWVSFPEKPGISPYDSDWAQVLADHKEDLTYQEIKNCINDLEPDQQITLVAMMYLGRGDYDVKEWASAVKEARYGWTRHTAQYLLSKPHVANYLEDGLALLGYYCNE